MCVTYFFFRNSTNISYNTKTNVSHKRPLLSATENGPFIVLAPSESAFSRLSRDDLRQLARGEDLSFHLVPLRGQSPPQVTDDAIFFTLDGSEVRFNVYDGATYVNGVAVRRKNIEFPQGVIYVSEE